MTFQRTARPPSLHDESWSVPSATFNAMDMLLIGGLLALSLQVVQISVVQLGHLWVMLCAGLMVLQGKYRISAAELTAYLLFISVACILTFLQDFPRVKEVDQLIKFIFFYPCFYFAGRWLGWNYREKPLPVGYMFLFGFLIFQYATQLLSLPVIYKEISFGQGALHGTFRERNWLAVYFLVFSYILLLKDTSKWKWITFFALNIVVMLLSGSKTTFVACGIIFLLQARIPLLYKIAPAIMGVVLYIIVFGDELTGDRLNVKLEEERGLAFQAAVDLIGTNPLGYGFGFVEAYFSRVALTVRGLGEGVNSVFAVPLDLWIVAGAAGLVFWAVFFVGVGNRTMKTLAPIAALSLLNPLHQSELVYFFIGMLASITRWQDGMARFKRRPLT